MSMTSTEAREHILAGRKTAVRVDSEIDLNGNRVEENLLSHCL